MLLMTRRPRPAGWRASGGQALVEFSLVAPLFFLIVFGILQLGLTFGSQNGLVNGTREVARYAATYRFTPTQAEADAACAAVIDHLHDALPRFVPAYDEAASEPEVRYEWLENPDGETYSLNVTVTVVYGHLLIVPIAGAILDSADGSIDNHLAATASEQMRVESLPFDEEDTGVLDGDPLAVCS